MSRLTDEQMIQVRINMAVNEALSANNAKWREKIEEYKQDVPDSAGKYYKIVIPEDEWQSILSQMEGE